MRKLTANIPHVNNKYLHYIMHVMNNAWIKTPYLAETGCWKNFGPCHVSFMSLFSTLLNRLLSVLITKRDLPISSREDQSKSRLHSITSQSAFDCSVPSKGYINGVLYVQFIYLHINQYIAACNICYSANQNQYIELRVWYAQTLPVRCLIMFRERKQYAKITIVLNKYLQSRQTKLICKRSTAFNMHCIVSGQQQYLHNIYPILSRQAPSWPLRVCGRARRAVKFKIISICTRMQKYSGCRKKRWRAQKR